MSTSRNMRLHKITCRGQKVVLSRNTNNNVAWISYLHIMKGINPVDTWRELNVHETFRRRPGYLLNIFMYVQFTSYVYGEPEQQWAKKNSMQLVPCNLPIKLISFTCIFQELVHKSAVCILHKHYLTDISGKC